MIRIWASLTCALATEDCATPPAEQVSMLQVSNRRSDKSAHTMVDSDPRAEYDVVGDCNEDSDACLQNQLHWKASDTCKSSWLYCVSGIEAGDARWGTDVWECCPKTCSHQLLVQRGKPGKLGNHRRRWQPSENQRRRKWDSHRRRWVDRNVSLNYAIDHFNPPCMEALATSARGGGCAKSAQTCRSLGEDSDVCLRHQKGWEATSNGIQRTCSNSHEWCIGDKHRTFDMLKCCPATCSRAMSPQWQEAPAMQETGSCAASHEACDDAAQDSDFCLHHRRGNQAYCEDWGYWCRDRGSKGADVRDCCPKSCKEADVPADTEERTRRREGQRRRTTSGGHNMDERRRRSKNGHAHNVAGATSQEQGTAADAGEAAESGDAATDFGDTPAAE